MTASGYPFVVKLWKRGTPLESATEVFRGKPTDLGAGGFTIHDNKQHTLTLFTRNVTIFESETWVLTPDGTKQLAIPTKANVAALLMAASLLSIDQDWTPSGQLQTFKQGSLLDVKLADVLKDPAHLKPSIVFTPTPDEFLEGAATTKSRLLVTTLKHVQGRAYIYTPTLTGWTHKELPVPANVSVNVVSHQRRQRQLLPRHHRIPHPVLALPRRRLHRRAHSREDRTRALRCLQRSRRAV